MNCLHMKINVTRAHSPVFNHKTVIWSLSALLLCYYEGALLCHWWLINLANVAQFCSPFTHMLSVALAHHSSFGRPDQLKTF